MAHSNPQKHTNTLITLEEMAVPVIILATLEETTAPVISCYLNLEQGTSEYRNTLDERARLLRKSLTGEARLDFEEALNQIKAFIRTELLPDVKGVAIFARGGAQPFFLPLQFGVLVPNWIAVDSTPNIYHLVELKDTYHRYVVMISTEDSARILEVNLGAVTEQMWKERPELRKRVGREWTKEHYQHHRQERTHQFIKEKIELLEQLMVAGGHTHLILAGNPRVTARVRNMLPKHLASKLVDTVTASAQNCISEVVAVTLAVFVAQEERESLAMVDRLQREIHRSGLAVVGTDASLKALKRGQVDVLVLAQAYDPEPGWSCAACGAIGVNRGIANACPECGANEIRELNFKEEMVRMAEQNGCKVEVVTKSAVLMPFGGVGCLLRYLTPEQYDFGF